MNGTETSRFLDLLAAARAWYVEHPDDAKKLAGEPAKTQSIEETAAWVATCRIMLNMDEFITRN